MILDKVKQPSGCSFFFFFFLNNKIIIRYFPLLFLQNFPSTSTDVSPRTDLSTLPPLKRDRVHTISVMSPVRKPPRDWASASSTRQRNETAPRSGVNPRQKFNYFNLIINIFKAIEA